MRLWCARHGSCRQLSCTKILSRPSVLEFSPDGNFIGVGTELGELIIITCSHINSNITHSNQEVEWTVALRRFISSRHKQKVGVNNQVIAERKNPSVSKVSAGCNSIEITCLKYSPSGTVLAVGCRDKLIHILSVSGGYKRVALCRGHSSFPRHIDFSCDELYIQSNDAIREILYWNVSTGERERNSKLRNALFHTWTCVYGWFSQGVQNGILGVDEGDIYAVNRSKHGDLLVAGGSNTVDGSVKLFRFPCLNDAIPIVYTGHTSPVVDVSFLAADEMVVSIGGNDMSIFLWNVV